MSDYPMKILVVEDEMIIGAKLSMYLTDMGYEVTGLIPRAEEALLHLKESRPDMVLLDIRLKGAMDGIELAGILQEQDIPVIFLTANSDDATFDQAKMTSPYAFLSKPVEKRDLKRVLELAANLYAGKEQPAAEKKEESPDPLADRLFVYDGDKRVKLLFDSIHYIQAERNYCRIVTREKEHLLSMPMKSLESELPAQLFQRIHRSYIVNLKQVDEVDDSSVRIGKSILPMSQSYRKDFLLRIKLV